MSTRTIRLFAVTALLSVVAYTPARAQFGSLIKKAKDKVQQQAEPEKGKPSDAFGPELTEQSFTALLKGLTIEDQQLAQRDEVDKQRGVLAAERRSLLDKNDKERQQWNDASSKTRSCRNDAFDKLRRAHDDAQEKKMQALANDIPKMTEFMKAYQKVEQQSMAMMARKDTAGAIRLQEAFMQKYVGVDLHADTVAVQKQCGSLPPKPAWMLRVDTLDVQIDKLGNDERALEEQARGKAVEASGMSDDKFALARERLVNYLAEIRDKTPIQQFGKDERKLLDAHRGDIQRLKHAL